MSHLGEGGWGFDPSLGRFTSPDTIVPTSTQGTQAWDRYAFVNNNPVRYNDPTGHVAQGDTPPPPCTEMLNPECIATPFPLPSATPTPTPGPSIGPANPQPPKRHTDISVDWDMVDKPQALLDVAGIIGDVALVAIPEGPGEILDGVITLVEVVSAGKTIYDAATNGDLSGLTLEAAFQNLEYNFKNNPLVPARAGRWIPLVGSIGSGFSLWSNLSPAITISVTYQ